MSWPTPSRTRRARPFEDGHLNGIRIALCFLAAFGMLALLVRVPLAAAGRLRLRARGL